MCSYYKLLILPHHVKKMQFYHPFSTFSAVKDIVLGQMRLYRVTAPRRTCQELPTCAHSEQALNTKDAEAGGPFSLEDPGQQVVAVNIMICVGG